MVKRARGERIITLSEDQGDILESVNCGLLRDISLEFARTGSLVLLQTLAKHYMIMYGVAFYFASSPSPPQSCHYLSQHELYGSRNLHTP